MRLSPGASFWVFGDIGDLGWKVLGSIQYESNGATGGGIEGHLGRTVATTTLREGNYGSSVTVKASDYTKHDEGDWKHTMKQNPSLNLSGQDDVYDSTGVFQGSVFYVLPIENPKNVQDL